MKSLRKRSTPLVVALVLIVAALGMASLVRSSGAQAKPGSKPAMTKEDALNLERKFWDTLIADDTNGMAKIMADDAAFIHGNAQVDTKAEFIAAMATPVVTRYEREEPTTVVFFPGGAIVRGTADVTVKQEGQDGSVQKLVRHQSQSSVWVSTAGGWKLMLIQQTPIQAPRESRGGPPQ